MQRIHPRTAAAIFGLSYYFIGLLISIFTKINLFEYKLYIVPGIVIGLIIHIIFEKGYYDEILEEKRREKEILSGKKNYEE